jgi:hypothetical protein
MMVVEEQVNGEVGAVREEDDGADITEPMFEPLQTLCERGCGDGAIGDEPCEQEYRQGSTQAEHSGHKACNIYMVLSGDCHLYHCEKIHKPMRAKSDSEEDAEHKRP